MQIVKSIILLVFNDMHEIHFSTLKFLEKQQLPKVLQNQFN